jgi:large subunit ribosomal protein L22
MPDTSAGEARAVARYIRMSPQKVREMVDLIRGKDLREALAILKFTPRRASAPVTKLVQSAAANAEHNYEMDRENLYVAECFVDQGPTIKRYQARAMGRADLLRKRTSHITVVLRERQAK